LLRRAVANGRSNKTAGGVHSPPAPGLFSPPAPGRAFDRPRGIPAIRNATDATLNSPRSWRFKKKARAYVTSVSKSGSIVAGSTVGEEPAIVLCITT
jgi:hypothetical protein